jgi:hypothetical protein
MNQKQRLTLPLPLVACAVMSGLLCPSQPLSAATIWNGPTITFTKPNGGDPTLAENQDRMTSNVWVTRAATHGIYNAKAETGYARFFSPGDTEWSYGLLADYASLSYTNWEGMFGGSAGGGPPSMLNKDAVVHLKTDDIYLSIKFTAWSMGVAGGGFTYLRSTPGSVQPPPPSPKLANLSVVANGSFRFSFTNAPGYTFTVLGSTNAALAISNWTVLGTVTDSPAGFYQFTDSNAPANSRRFYVVRWP